MNRHLLTSLALVVVCSTSCSTTGPGAQASDGATPAAPASVPADAMLDDARYAHYGAGVHAGDAVAVSDVLRTPKEFVGRPLRVRGPIDSVCKVKGCWVRVGATDENVLVRFKDYGFFLPLDASGEIVLEGDLKVEEIPVATLRHYLEDEGRHAEAAKITEPQTKVTFLATGAAIAKTDPAARAK